MRKFFLKTDFTFSKYFIILFILLVTFIGLSACSYARSVTSDLTSSVFRLHVIANSDSTEDQNLKYKVRDALISYMNNLSVDLSSKEDVIKISQNHINNFKEVALDVIHDNGFNYDVSVSIGNFEFPTKTYGDISLPAGYYDALKVQIGNAQGQNWWCVMFPPLCFVDITSGVVPEDSKENLKENLSEEDYSIISKDDSITQFKFKIIEFFKNFKLADN